MATLINTLWEGVRYRGGIGNWAYLFHRLAGIATLLFLAIHIVDTATVFFFPSLYQHAIEIYRSTPFMLGEIALVAGVLFHGANGLKITFVPLQPGPAFFRSHQPSTCSALSVSSQNKRVGPYSPR